MLVVFDVDHFKHINDRYGHLQGDVCLSEIADCIKKAYASYGYCYRIGGDEFCVLLKDAQREAACAREFLRCLEERRQTIAFLPTVSFWRRCAFGENMEKVKEQADRRMYRYKKRTESAFASAEVCHASTPCLMRAILRNFPYITVNEQIRNFAQIPITGAH